jgi:hypothetical protein
MGDTYFRHFTSLYWVRIKIQSFVKSMHNFFHSCTVHLDAIKVFYLPTDAQ